MNNEIDKNIVEFEKSQQEKIIEEFIYKNKIYPVIDGYITYNGIYIPVNDKYEKDVNDAIDLMTIFFSRMQEK